MKKLFEEDVEQPIVSLIPSEQVDRQIKGYLALTMKVVIYSVGTIVRMSFLLLLHWQKDPYVFVELVFHLNAFSVKVDT